MAKRKGMTTDELLFTVNKQRMKLGLQKVELRTRPSSTENYNKKHNRFERGITIEVFNESNEVLQKSINWGVITSYLRGMLQAFTDAPVLAPERPLITTGRRLET